MARITRIARYLYFGVSTIGYRWESSHVSASRVGIARPRDHAHVRRGGYARQRLAPKSQRNHARQPLKREKLACRVPLERKLDFFGRDPVPIVRNAYAL